ncbi:hypothetical protein LWI28_004040 [Acer negundo]|uniref:Protein kinase domain-containing protein n=1 Tax=Acer negundo TaxID=4023 RepID=A0AAD5NWB8_ACENE|nr:hypothetical protein LWI28_004040 [Acer negundo]
MVDCIGAIVVALKRGSSVGSSDSSRHRYITEEINKIGKGNITANIFSYRELCVATSNFNPENMLCETLDRNTRMKIARAAAKGLEYLHESASPPVIYSDFKASNILLDKDFNAKLSDLGLAKLGPTGDKTHVYSFRVVFLKKSHRQFKTNKRAESSYLGGSSQSLQPTPAVQRRNEKLITFLVLLKESISVILANISDRNCSGESRDGAAESVEIQNRRFGATIMMIGVVLLVGYMMFSNKRVSSTSSYSKQMKDFVLLAFVDCVCVLMVDCIGAIVVALKRGSSVGSSDSSRHRYITEEINEIGKGNITANIFSYRELCVATSNFNPENMLCEALDRNTRMKIARAAAKGLEYLHESASPSVIYSDFKASNILLDKDFNAKLSDLGLAKLGPTGDKTHVYSFRVVFLKKSHRQFKTNKRAESSYLGMLQLVFSTISCTMPSTPLV